MLVKLHDEDLTALLALADVLTGKRGRGTCFDSQLTLRPFFACAVMNAEAALRGQRKRDLKVKGNER